MYNIKHADISFTSASGKLANQRKVKKMGFFKRWILKQVQQGYALEREGTVVPTAILSEQKIDQPDKAIRFTVYMANGGRVVETHRYERKLDRNHNSLYVITSDKDFGKEIDKIITLESLK